MFNKRILLTTILIITLFLCFTGSVFADAPVIYFTYLFNFNLSFAPCPVNSTNFLIEQGHIPLLELFEKHNKWTTQFFFSGYTADYLQENYPDVIKKVKNGVKRGNYELGTYTLAHPILSLTPYNNLIRQLKKGIEIDKRVWNIKPKGLFLPENAWDVCLPDVIDEVGIEWISLYKEIIPEFAEKSNYPATVFIEGINNKKAKAVICSHYIDRGSLEDFKKKMNTLYEELKKESIRECLIALKNDGEVIYFQSMAMLNKDKGTSLKWGDKMPELPAIKSWDEKLTLIENLPYAKFITMSEYLKKHPPKRTLTDEDISLIADFSKWLSGEGVERLNILTNEARTEVISAEYVVNLAEKMGMDVTESRKRLEEAWYQLMLSEGADGRATRPHSSRKVFVADAAVKAIKLAKKAADTIKK